MLIMKICFVDSRWDMVLEHSRKEGLGGREDSRLEQRVTHKHKKLEDRGLPIPAYL